MKDNAWSEETIARNNILMDARFLANKPSVEIKQRLKAKSKEDLLKLKKALSGRTDIVLPELDEFI